MPTQIQLRRGTTAEHASYTGPEGEVTVDTTEDRLVLHDGTTAGGIPMATQADLAGDASQDFSASTVNATTVDLGDWTITQSGSDLKFAYNGTNRFSLSSSGALTVEANVTAYGSA
jgi:ethanolamine utilization protein EutA (predicted chaperonin)